MGKENPKNVERGALLRLVASLYMLSSKGDTIQRCKDHKINNISDFFIRLENGIYFFILIPHLSLHS